MFFRQASRVIAVICLLLWPALAAAADGLKDLLSHEIISAEGPLEEVQVFTESRVPRMPKLTNLEDWRRRAEQIRRDVLDKVVFRGQAVAWRDAKTQVAWGETIEGGPGYHIKKLSYEALPGLWIPALLYVPDKLTDKTPVALNVNGHDGQGKAAKYKQLRCINQAKRGMLALNVEWLGMGQLRGEGFRHYSMNQLDLCGTSGLAPFYLSMKRGLDVLLSLEHADPKRVAVAGLSGGGWQTIFISSLDTRVTLSNPVAGYSSFRTRARNLSDLGDSEQTPSDLATVADYAHLTALMAPRTLLLTFNEKDNCCFASGHALPPLREAAAPVYQLFGQEDRLRWHVNRDPGTHNFLQDNREALYRALGDAFFAGSEGFQRSEIASDDEVKSYEALQVRLPENNADFQVLARGLCKSLPEDPRLPTTRPAAEAWRKRRSRELSALVRAKTYEVIAKPAGSQMQGEIQARFWKLRMGGDWTVPAVELTRGQPQGTTLLVADGGRVAAEAAIRRLLEEGQRVVAVDPFYFGESKIAKRDFLFALLVAAVGERPLGLQASQVAAVSRWLAETRKLGPVRVVAQGPRSSLFALIAAGLSPETISESRLGDSFATLHEILEQKLTVNKAPELFCFGLLQKFDIKQLAALAAPRKVVFDNATPRAKRELAELADYYQVWGVTHQSAP